MMEALQVFGLVVLGVVIAVTFVVLLRIAFSVVDLLAYWWDHL